MTKGNTYQGLDAGRVGRACCGGEVAERLIGNAVADAVGAPGDGGERVAGS